jgi:polysaccharide export outer membrane protein
LPDFRWLRHSHGQAEPTIRPFDRLSLVIWDSEPNSLLTSEAERLVNLPEMTVNSAGQIFIPYVGDVRVADRTAAAARRQLQREMEAIIPSAQVQLTRTGGTRSSASLVTGMSQPGSYPIVDGHTTVLNLLSQAGGPNEMRNPVIRLTRAGQTFRIPLQTLYDEPAADSIVRGGDKISVEQDVRYFRALGASGREEIVDFDRAEISALDAMSLIGGLSDNVANPKGVLILREYPVSALRNDGSGPDNTRVVFSIDMTTSDGLFSAGRFPIQHQDTVLVTESPINSIRSVFSLVGSAFGLVSTISN